MKIEIVKDDNHEYDDEIYSLIVKAFKQDNEAKLVNNIKEFSDFYISYIAFVDGQLAGNVVISPMLLNGQRDVLCLAPVSVLEKYQNTGIGTSLIKKAISQAMTHHEYKFITVLGSEHYYQRFGFEPYNPHKYQLPFDIEDRYFQILDIEKDASKNLAGQLDYPSYFVL
ncbi:MAG: N-acetyltransferase [Bacilli bacterium]|jgi:predicted N-acetyltransferase YhbS|nr:N-acetyltransferase [Bacilli bacterium]